jgi:lysophospholipase L1-like esterase
VQDDRDPQFGLGKSVAFSLILITLTLTGAELAVRGWARYLRDPYQRFDPASETFVLVPGEHRTRTSHVVVNSDGFVGRELQQPGPDLWRLAAVGDSCTFSAGNATDTYAAMTEDALRANAPSGVRYEVVNAGIEGLNSELALRRLRHKVLPLAPEVVTIYLGWNDLMKYDPNAQEVRTESSRATRVLNEIWLIRGMRKLIFFYLRPRIAPPTTGPASFTGRFADFHPTVFESNLREIVAEVRNAGAAPLLFSLPTVVRADMTADDLRAANVVFPYFSAGYGVGDFLDLIGAYNESIRAIARELDVPVVELAKEFDAEGDVRSLFYDTMHTTKKGQALIARLLEAKLAQEGLLAPRPELPGRVGHSITPERGDAGSAR